jgi:hypothetical protein
LKPAIVLINPWIYDFAAFDLWSKPLGLLFIAGYLRKHGFRIHLIDCLSRHHPDTKEDRRRESPYRHTFGTGKFNREQVPKPTPLRHVTRPFSRYGIPRELFIKELERVENPAAILVTSLMTYWYLGVNEVIALAKDIHPGVPVYLGGIYATPSICCMTRLMSVY